MEKEKHTKNIHAKREEQSLPWTSVPGPVYEARELKPRKRWVTVGGWIFCVILLLGGLMTRYHVLVIFSFLYALCLLMKKDVVVTGRGLEFYYQMRITTHYECYKWEDMVSVVREDRNHPELVALYFGIGEKAKRLFFTKEDSGKIMALARRQNPKLLVEDAEAPKKRQGRTKKR